MLKQETYSWHARLLEISPFMSSNFWIFLWFTAFAAVICLNMLYEGLFHHQCSKTQWLVCAWSVPPCSGFWVGLWACSSLGLNKQPALYMITWVMQCLVTHFFVFLVGKGSLIPSMHTWLNEWSLRKFSVCKDGHISTEQNDLSTEQNDKY